MKLKIKNKPQLPLIQLLRRRKTSLSRFMSEQGITTYEGLINRCNTMGVLPPTEEEYAKVKVPLVSNPQEGLVVLDPIPVLSEMTGRESEKVANRPTLNDLLDIQPAPRKRKKTLPPPPSVENNE